MSSKEASVNNFEVEIRGGQKERDEAKSQSSAARLESSGKGSTEEASRALLVMQRGEPRSRGRKRRQAGDDSNPQKKKRVGEAAAGDIRPTAVIGAYFDFMKRLGPKIRQWHRDAYCGSPFEHYIQFGAPALDRRTLEHVLSFYVPDKQTFSIPDANSGEKKLINLDVGWVHNHTYFPIYGELITTNRDNKCRLWVQYFSKLFKDEKGGKKRKADISIRRYVEDLLESLVESAEKKDIQDFVLLQILYQCSMIWCPRSGDGFPRILLRYLDSIEMVNKVAWGDFFYKEIIRGIKVALEGLKKPGVTYVPGCMPLIPLWYYEMTGIRRYVISDRCRPPMTNWVSEGGKAGSFRMGTIKEKAKTASIMHVEKPIVEVGPPLSNHPARKVPSPDMSKLPPPVPRKDFKLKRRLRLKAKNDGAEKNDSIGHFLSSAKRSRKVKIAEAKKDSIGYIIAKQLDDAFEKEEEVEALPIEEQVMFWRNSAKFCRRLLSATKRRKSAYCHVFTVEIRRLNGILESLGRSDDVIDPEVLKARVKNNLPKMSKFQPRVDEEEHHSPASIVQESEEGKDEDDLADVDSMKNNVDEDPMREVAEEEPAMKEKVADGVPIEGEKEDDEVPIEGEKQTEAEQEEVGQFEERTSGGDYFGVDEEIVHKGIEEKIENKIEGVIVDKDGEELVNEGVEEKIEEKNEEEIVNKDVIQQVDAIVEALTSATQKKGEKVAKKKSQSMKIRAPSRRATKRSQHVRTPYTEGKKNKEQDITEVLDLKSPPIIEYFNKQDLTWSALSMKSMTQEEESLLKELNAGIPDPSGFSARIIDSAGTFLHNYRIPPIVSSRLNPTENKFLTHFCSLKCDRSHDVIRTGNSSMSRYELLYLLRGGRLDDTMEEAVLDRLKEEAYGKKYGLVSVFFCHELHSKDPDFYGLFLSYLEQYTAVRIERLLIPVVRDDHWHLVEVILSEGERVIRHYSSAPHDTYKGPVIKIMTYFDYWANDFKVLDVRREFRYEAIKCEQQVESYDCGVFVYHYIRAIINGRSTSRVTPEGEPAAVMRARLAAELLIEGREQREKNRTLHEDDLSL